MSVFPREPLPGAVTGALTFWEVVVFVITLCAIIFPILSPRMLVFSFASVLWRGDSLGVELVSVSNGISFVDGGVTAIYIGIPTGPVMVALL